MISRGILSILPLNLTNVCAFILTNIKKEIISLEVRIFFYFLRKMSCRQRDGHGKLIDGHGNIIEESRKTVLQSLWEP